MQQTLPVLIFTPVDCGVGWSQYPLISLKVRQEQVKRTMSVHCHACGSRNLRPSRLQLRDFVFLLTFRFPVRCRYCRDRFYASIFSIRKIWRDARARDIRHENDAPMS